MNKIIVRKAKLLNKLRENMELHDEIYEEAYENYWDTVSKKFDLEIKEVRTQIKNREFDKGGVYINISINAPQNNRDSYEQAIGMLEWTEQDEIELDARQFERYVRNNWEWKDSFKMSNTMYLSSTGSAKFDIF